MKSTNTMDILTNCESSLEYSHLLDSQLLELLDDKQFPAELDDIIYQTQVLDKISDIKAVKRPYGCADTAALIKAYVKTCSNIQQNLKPTYLVPIIQLSYEEEAQYGESSKSNKTTPLSSKRNTTETELTVPDTVEEFDNASTDYETKDEVVEETQNAYIEHIVYPTLASSSNSPSSSQLNVEIIDEQPGAVHFDLPGNVQVWSWPGPEATTRLHRLPRFYRIRTIFTGPNPAYRISTISPRYAIIDTSVPFTPSISWKDKLHIPELPKPAEVLWKVSDALGFPPRQSACTACLDVTPNRNMIKLSCKHRYCHTCLHDMLLSAMNDEARMPPKCCTQQIKPKYIKLVLSQEEHDSFAVRLNEFTTPHDKRVYCPGVDCGVFVPLDPRSSTWNALESKCPKCDFKVCRICKLGAHEFGQDCPQDTELEDVLKIAEDAGWRRCFRCRVIVELTAGCNHMTCRCGAEFCYVCGSVWTGECPNDCSMEAEYLRRLERDPEALAEQAEIQAMEEVNAAQDAVIEAIIAEQETRRQQMPTWQQNFLTDPDVIALLEKHEAEMEVFWSYQEDVHRSMAQRHHEKWLDMVFAHEEALSSQSLEEETQRDTLDHTEEKELDSLPRKWHKSRLSRSDIQDCTEHGNSVERNQITNIQVEADAIKAKYEFRRAQLHDTILSQQATLRQKHDEELENMNRLHGAETELVHRELRRRKGEIKQKQRLARDEILASRQQETGLVMIDPESEAPELFL